VSVCVDVCVSVCMFVDECLWAWDRAESGQIL